MTKPKRPEEYIYFEELVEEKVNKIILKVLKDIFDRDEKTDT